MSQLMEFLMRAGRLHFMYGNNGELLFDVDATGTKREYGYVAGRNIVKRESK